MIALLLDYIILHYMITFITLLDCIALHYMITLYYITCFRMPNILAAKFIYLVTSAEYAGPINRTTTVKGLNFMKKN